MDDDGVVVVVLGVRRLSSAGEAVRSVRPGGAVTPVVATDGPTEVGRLARLRIADLVGCLRRMFAEGELPLPRVVFDDMGTVCAAIGREPADDHTEVAIRVRGGLIVARADGRGAGHAVADRDASGGRAHEGRGQRDSADAGRLTDEA
ncbi:hypothetical protein [Streptomyces sp. NPDC101181]|uniref:hypothetical protein n=1 Tax=Streptomyces sp. NPDC101181 TaxID=3366125 RepID=UPI0037F37DC5